MSDIDQIPEWGNKLARRLRDLEDQWQALQERLAATPAPPATPPASLSPSPTSDPAEAERARQLLAALERDTAVASTRLAEARQQAEAAETRAAEQARIAHEAEGTFTARENTLRAQADQLAQTRRVIELIWPRFMRTPDFADWRQGIETALLADAPSSSAALLFANLHGYTACLLENDQKYLRDGLRDISRFLYAWLKETGRDERESFEVALAWAAAFNEECAGRCEIEVPEPGTPANALSMTFPPRGSSPEVVSVRTWCVRDATRRVIHRAEVFI